MGMLLNIAVPFAGNLTIMRALGISVSDEEAGQFSRNADESMSSTLHAEREQLKRLIEEIANLRLENAVLKVRLARRM
jgi:hypothetical protein